MYAALDMATSRGDDPATAPIGKNSTDTVRCPQH